MDSQCPTGHNETSGAGVNINVNFGNGTGEESNKQVGKSVTKIGYINGILY